MRHGQLQHHGGQREHDERVQRNEREQRHQPGLAIGQADERDADGHGVAEGGGQRHHCGAAQGTLPEQHDDKQQNCSGKINRHRLEVQPLDMHRAHGAKQQRGREHRKYQHCKVFCGLSPYVACITSYKPDSNHQNDGNQGRQDDGIHVRAVGSRPSLPTAA